MCKLCFKFSILTNPPSVGETQSSVVQNISNNTFKYYKLYIIYLWIIVYIYLQYTFIGWDIQTSMNIAAKVPFESQWFFQVPVVRKTGGLAGTVLDMDAP